MPQRQVLDGDAAVLWRVAPENVVVMRLGGDAVIRSIEAGNE